MSDSRRTPAEAARFRDDFQHLREAVGQVIVGQQRVVEGVLTAIIAGGNVLLEGVPGLGKTELVKTLARALDLDFRRIQFTPDLMPADIVGTNVMTTGPDGRYEFEFRRGPIFTQILLADEINRATPKTQSALLETMQEGSVTAAGTTHILDAAVLRPRDAKSARTGRHLSAARGAARPLHVQAQRAVPQSRRAERSGPPHHARRRHVEVPKIIDGPRIMELRAILEKVVVADPLRDYAVRLVLATHPERVGSGDTVRRFVKWGASPRAVQALIRAARVRALAEGRAHVAFEDIRHFAPEVLGHRVLLNYDGLAENLSVPGPGRRNRRKVVPEEAAA